MWNQFSRILRRDWSSLKFNFSLHRALSCCLCVMLKDNFPIWWHSFWDASSLFSSDSLIQTTNFLSLWSLCCSAWILSSYWSLFILGRGLQLVYFTEGVSKHWDLMFDDLRWSWCNKNASKVHNKSNVLESSWNHPPTPRSMENLSSMKPVPGDRQVGDCCFRELTGSRRV